MSEHDDRAQDGTDPTYGEGSGSSAATPAAYPPPAPYPPAGSEPADPARDPGEPSPYGQAGSDPYGRPAPDPHGQGTPGPYGQATPPASGPGTPSYSPQGYGSSQPYGGPVAPEQGQQPYGQQVPYGQGYGSSAAYTSTPQPYAYGPPALSPEAEKVRSSAVLWTILNGVAIFLCGNLLAIGGVVLAAIAIGRAREDVERARGLVKWSWILFAIGFALGLLLLVGYVVFLVVLGTAGSSGMF